MPGASSSTQSAGTVGGSVYTPCSFYVTTEEQENGTTTYGYRLTDEYRDNPDSDATVTFKYTRDILGRPSRCQPVVTATNGGTAEADSHRATPWNSFACIQNNETGEYTLFSMKNLQVLDKRGNVQLCRADVFAESQPIPRQ